MWMRGRDSKRPGEFSYSLYAQDGTEVETVGGFKTAQAADRAAEIAQRVYLLRGAKQEEQESDEDLLKSLLD